MLKRFSSTAKVVVGLLLLIVIIVVVLMSLHGNQPKPQRNIHYMTDNASADTKVETLKTMTADLVAVQQQNQKLGQEIATLKQQNRQVVEQAKASVNDALRHARQQWQAEQQQSSFNHHDEHEGKRHTTSPPVTATSHQHHPGFIWIGDIATAKKSATTTASSTSTDQHHVATTKAAFWHHTKPKKAAATQPYYTIPENATLTDAVLMTPLVGRIPINDNVTDPYHFKAVLSANNLTANGYPLPGIHGAVISGVARGDMLGRCARGEVTSITFIFNDGTISTTTTKSQNNSAGLGYISAASGNPCLAGTFHSNAAIFLGAQIALAGAAGYSRALSQSQLTATTSPNGSMLALVGSGNQYAMGQGAAAAMQAAQQWWDERVKSSFDYVYVPNINPQTDQPIKIAINVTQPIDIDHNSQARKVAYDPHVNQTASALD